ncbi:membrane protein [Kitasatospora xanthocidica]|uniref:PP2C family protein-serine/threonine phosphatase n=1 Tax=Kitasatospora xanthocidica TaxID=83382 RepID=UPI001674C3DB|nr:PP2C family protein-serine/threonine phosphatase [Kitasatospora xanthocidica]GHF67700.1 membrane protein [Kitasatospora xanthocidica]
MPPRSEQWPPYVRVAPWLLIVGGLVWNALEPADYWGDPLLAAAAVLAGALLWLRDTVAVGVANVTGILLLSTQDGSIGTGDGYLELANTAFAALLGVGVNRVVARHGQRLERVRSVAEAAQRAVLPEPPGRVGRLAVAACYRAAQDEALIGGDAYALQVTPYGVRGLIADVRGKGLHAVGAVSVLLGAFRESSHRVADLAALADALEDSLLREADRLSEELRLEGFITALLVEFRPGEDAVRTLDCGHPGPYLLCPGPVPQGGGSRVRRLDAADPGLPLGMGGLGIARPAPETRPFPPGCTLLLVTDGVTEARDAAGEFYDPVLGLAPLGPFAGPDEVLDALVADVERWAGGPRDDDMAVLAITHRAAD